MESVFSRFESYDFAADQRFQDGLKTLQGSAEGDKLRDMKLFFYNRCGSWLAAHKRRWSAEYDMSLTKGNQFATHF